MNEQKRIDTIMKLWRHVQNNWAKRNRLEYVVIPSADIRGKSLDEMKQLSFKVGVDNNHTVTLNIHDLTAFFLFLKDQADQLAKAATAAREAGQPAPSKASLSTIVNLAPSDDEIQSVISGIHFTMHVEESVGDTPMPNEKNLATAADFGLTEERVGFVLEMVRKKANAAMSQKPGNHFRVYAPQGFLGHPSIVNEPNAYEKLKDSVWWVRWYDDRYDQLRFIELLIFVQQIISTHFAFQQAATAVAKHPAIHRGSKHAGGWQPKKNRDGKPKRREDVVEINVKGGGFAPAELAKDEMIRILFSKVDIEKVVRPMPLRLDGRWVLVQSKHAAVWIGKLLLGGGDKGGGRRRPSV